MQNVPKKIETGICKGKVYCRQYMCLNNYGLQRGIIRYAEFPEGCCRLENPEIIDFGDGIWGCSNERYKGDIAVQLDNNDVDN